MAPTEAKHHEYCMQLWRAIHGPTSVPDGSDEQWRRLNAEVQRVLAARRSVVVAEIRGAVTGFEPIPVNGMEPTFRLAFEHTKRSLVDVIAPFATRSA